MKIIAEKIKTFKNSASAIHEINQLNKIRGVKNISFVNAHACNLAASNKEFEEALCNSDLLLRDGIDVKIMLRVFKLDVGYNSNGTDLIPLIFSDFSHKSIMLIGASEETIKVAANRFKDKGNDIVSFMSGFCSFENMLQRIQSTKPDIVVLGMGMPKQEIFSEYLKSSYMMDLIVVNGGAVFDFAAHNVPRAPLCMQKWGLEWLFRLLREPKRLFGRYVLGIPLFFIKLGYAKVQDSLKR